MFWKWVCEDTVLRQAYQLGTFSIYDTATTVKGEEEKSVQSSPVTETVHVAESVDETTVSVHSQQITDSQPVEKGAVFVSLRWLCCALLPVSITSFSF